MPTQHKHTGVSYRSGPIKLARDGPRIELAIRPPFWQTTRMKAAGFSPKKRSWKSQALIDTGASFTCIRDDIAQDLSLKKVGSTKVHTGAGSPKCPVYTAELIMGPFTFLSSIIGIPAKHQKIDCLLGRDILRRFTLVYSGPTEGFYLIDGVIALNQPSPSEQPK